MGLDRRVAAAIFLAVLGRATELAMTEHPDDNDYAATGLLLTILRRSLLTEAAPRRD